MDSIKNTAIIVAAGQGKRMNSSTAKQFMELKGYPLVYYSLKCFQESSVIDEVVLVTNPENVIYCQEDIVKKYEFTKVLAVVPGGKERYESVYEGLCACKDSDYVYIHDAARPFLTETILKRVEACLIQEKACVVGMPSKDTIKISDKDKYVDHTPDRSVVWSIQTPQAFAYDVIKEAHEILRKKDTSIITDDGMMVEAVGKCPVKLVEGSYENIKITTPSDLIIAESFLDL